MCEMPFKKRPMSPKIKTRRLNILVNANLEGPVTMNDVEMSRYIIETFKGVDVVEASGDSFFFYNPDSSVPPDHKFPFVTLVNSDVNDTFSDLNRPSVFRLNIG